MIIKVANNLTNSAPYTYTSYGEASGVTSIRVLNISQFTGGHAIQIGKTGEEQSEIRVLGTAAPSGTALSVGTATSFEHPADTPVYDIKFNQIVFMRSTAGTSGTATAITDGTINISADSVFTQFDDTTGAASYAYKTKFYNSVTTEESAESDWLTPSGYSFYSKAKLRERIRGKLYNSNFITDSQIDDWINEWLEVMNNAAVKVNKDYSLGTVDVAISATTGLGTITASDFKEIKRIDFTVDNVNYYLATKKDRSDFTTQQVFVDTHPYYYYQGDNIIGKLPGTGGTARLVYYKLVPVLTDDTDEIPTSMHGYTKSFIDWGVAQALWIDGKDGKAKAREQVAYSERDRFITEITPRNFNNQQQIDIVDVISDDYGGGWHY